jgi:molecular chaperone GrpE
MKEENDDIVIEDDPDSTSPAEVQKKLREKLKVSEKKAKEYLDGWQRSQADFANLRRRDEEDKVDFIKFANLSFIQELIPVLDSFNIALSSGHKDFEPLYNQFMAVLKSAGLEEINPLGEIFGPHEHEALGMLHTEKEGEDQKVLEVLQKGYKLNGRVIRPAKVRVGEYVKN